MTPQNLSINLIPNMGVSGIISIKQWDYGERIFNFYLYDNGQKFTIPSNTKATFQYTRPDGVGGSILCSFKDNVVTCDCTASMSAVSGSYNAEIRLLFSDGSIGSAPIIVCVQEAGISDKTQFQSGDRNLFRDAIDSALNIVSYKDLAEKNALNAAASASAAKTSEVNAKTSETNSKTSQANASASKSSAASSASSSEASASAAKASQTNSKTSQTNAAQSASAASNSATAAKKSQDNAAKSAASAASSAAALQYGVNGTILYLGTKGSN